MAIHSTFSHGPSTLALPNMIGFAFFNVYGRDRPSVCLFSAAKKVWAWLQRKMLFFSSQNFLSAFLLRSFVIRLNCWVPSRCHWRSFYAALQNLVDDRLQTAVSWVFFSSSSSFWALLTCSLHCQVHQRKFHVVILPSLEECSWLMIYKSVISCRRARNFTAFFITFLIGTEKYVYNLQYSLNDSPFYSCFNVQQVSFLIVCLFACFFLSFTPVWSRHTG